MVTITTHVSKREPLDRFNDRKEPPDRFNEYIRIITSIFNYSSSTNLPGSDDADYQLIVTRHCYFKSLDNEYANYIWMSTYSDMRQS